jgi:hypothetical protein
MRKVSGIETKHLSFGSALHTGLEIYYDFSRQPSSDADEDTKQQIMSVVEYEAIIAYQDYMNEWRRHLISIERYYPQSQEEWERLNKLGEDMLDGYFKWAEQEYRDYEVAYSEVEFEVPIPVHESLMVNVLQAVNENLNAFLGSHCKTIINDEICETLEPNTLYLVVLDIETNTWQLVTYQGRIDLIFRHKKSGRYWVVDHKSTQRFDPLTDWIDIDPQASSYYWAIKRSLGIDVEGVIINYLKKTVPYPPELIRKGKALSVNKAQNTTKALFRQSIKEYGFNPMDYAQFMDEFVDPEFYRCRKTYRSSDELDRIEEFIAKEAIDMLNDPMIYPNPSQFNCSGCAFKDPCHMMHSSGDDMWFIKESGAYEYNHERAIK